MTSRLLAAVRAHLEASSHQYHSETLRELGEAYREAKAQKPTVCRHCLEGVPVFDDSEDGDWHRLASGAWARCSIAQPQADGAGL